MSTAPVSIIFKARTGLGSVFNVNALKRDLLDFGLVQSDRNWQAWNGKGKGCNEPVTSARCVFSLHDELVHIVVHIVAHIDADIHTDQDLRGKRANIGNQSSGQRGNAITVMDLYGINANTELDSSSFQQGDAYHAYGDKTIDAFFYTVGVPSPSIAQVVKEVPSRFILLDKQILAPLVENAPHYVITEIPPGTYKGLTEPVPTLRVRATLMTSENVPDEMVYNLTKTFFENIDTVKSSHPALARLTMESAREGLSAPLHNGALKYYRDQGWVD